MDRQIYQKYGFVIALIIAGVSLPTSIISLTREPTIVNNNDYNDNFYNYYNQTYYGDNETTVSTISTIPHNIMSWNWEAYIFDYSEGDKMMAVWHSSNNPINAYFMSKENYQFFIDGLSFTTILSVINTTTGFFEYEVIIPNIYFTVFYNNYSNPSWINYHVTYIS